MDDVASARAGAFSAALESIQEGWVRRQRVSRRLLRRDPLEDLVPERLLFEGLEGFLRERSSSPEPLVLFMDRGGGREGARVATRVIPLIARHWAGVSYIHVSFNTPARGLGTLVRGMLQDAGAEHRVSVHVVAHNRPFEGLKVSVQEAEELTESCRAVVTFSSGGTAGLARPAPRSTADPLLSRSHLAVLTYFDPEALVAELPAFGGLLESEPALEAIRFWVQVETERGEFEDLGSTVLGGDGDAPARLWALIDNARRKSFRVLVEPLGAGTSAGDPLVCPCRAAIESELSRSAEVVRMVPAGSHIVAVARGDRQERGAKSALL